MQVPERSTLILQAQKELENEKASQKKKNRTARCKHQTSKFWGTYYTVCLASSTVKV